MVGTIRYMSPEQLTDSSSVDASADIYALGAILYECLSGVVPHSTSSIQQLMFDILNREPLPLRQLAPGLPNSVCELVTSCISKDSAARPSAHELAEALADELAPLPMSGSATTMSDVSPEAGWRAPQSSSRRSMALAACAVVSALGGAGIQAATSSAPVHANPPSPPPIATLGTTVACLAPTPPSNVTLGPALAGAPPGVAATRRSITARVASAPLTVGDAEPANVIRSGTFDMSNPYSE